MTTNNWNVPYDPNGPVQLAYYIQIVRDGKQWVARNRHDEKGYFDPEEYWTTPYPEIEALHELQEVLNVS